jgi:MioC protein
MLKSEWWKTLQTVSILVGTMTGTAELVAGEVQTALEGIGLDAKVTLMDDLVPESLTDDVVYLICTSTYGNGDVPDNAQAFFNALETGRPDLAKIRYGLISLGDRTYKATFAQGGLKFDALLTSLGAIRLGEPLLHDAASGSLPEDVAAEWSLAWAHDHVSGSEVAA